MQLTNVTSSAVPTAVITSATPLSQRPVCWFASMRACSASFSRRLTDCVVDSSAQRLRLADVRTSCPGPGAPFARV